MKKKKQIAERFYA